MHKEAPLSHYRVVEKVQRVIVPGTERRSREVRSCDFNGTAIAMKAMATNHAEIACQRRMKQKGVGCDRKK
jgi:phenylalanyl-tRNA synthetase beta subunit